MSFASQCKQCYHNEACKSLIPIKHDNGVWNTQKEKRETLRNMMMDCFKSPEQYKRDISSRNNSINKNK